MQLHVCNHWEDRDKICYAQLGSVGDNLEVITFRITNFPLAIFSPFFPSVLTLWLTAIRCDQGKFLSFYLHFSTAIGITKAGPIGSDPAYT